MSVKQHCHNMRAKKNDIVYTPKSIALKAIEMCDITENMTVLDPSKGGGIFYDNLPICKKSYCEITEDKDFFKWNEKVDLVIGNPPFSLWTKWLEHTVSITDKFCYIFGAMNLSDSRMRKILDSGYGITKIHLFSVDWWFSQSFIVLFEKGKPSIMTVSPQRILCDICNERCDRGLNGNSMNECVPRIKKPVKPKHASKNE